MVQHQVVTASPVCDQNFKVPSVNAGRKKSASSTFIMEEFDFMPCLFALLTTIAEEHKR
jgi:hypothetical protein